MTRGHYSLLAIQLIHCPRVRSVPRMVTPRKPRHSSEGQTGAAFRKVEVDQIVGCLLSPSLRSCASQVRSLGAERPGTPSRGAATAILPGSPPNSSLPRTPTGRAQSFPQVLAPVWPPIFCAGSRPPGGGGDLRDLRALDVRCVTRKRPLLLPPPWQCESAHANRSRPASGSPDRRVLRRLRPERAVEVIVDRLPA